MSEEKKNEVTEVVKEETRELTEEELEKVTGGKTGVTPWEGDPVAAKLADAPTNLAVIKRIDVAARSAELAAVKLAIDEATRR